VVTIELARSALLWCAVINYAFLLLWFLLYLLLRGWLHRIWGRWFRLTPEQFDVFNFGGMLIYKLGVFLLNLAPWLALQIAA
jgi:hypothetical protein